MATKLVTLSYRKIAITTKSLQFFKCYKYKWLNKKIAIGCFATKIANNFNINHKLLQQHKKCLFVATEKWLTPFCCAAL